MNYRKNMIILLILIGMSFIAGSIIKPVQAKGFSGAAASRSIASSTSRSMSKAATSSSRSVSRAAASKQSLNSAKDLERTVYIAAGSTALTNIIMNSSDDSKNPQEEIYKRIAIVNLAKNDDDAAVMEEAAIARGELKGYQDFRAEAKNTRPAPTSSRAVYKELFGEYSPQDAIAIRMSIIKLVGDSDDPVLIDEAKIARSELKGYRAWRDTLTQSEKHLFNSGSKTPKDEIVKRISIISIGIDSDDEVMMKETDVARKELAGYQAYRSSNAPKPISDSRNPQDEVEWRLSIIKTAQTLKDDVVEKESDIAKEELLAYRKYKDSGEKEVAPKPKQESTLELSYETPKLSPEDQAINKEIEEQTRKTMGVIVRYGSFGVVIMIGYLILKKRKEKKDLIVNKYIKKK